MLRNDSRSVGVARLFLLAVLLFSTGMLAAEDWKAPRTADRQPDLQAVPGESRRS